MILLTHFPLPQTDATNCLIRMINVTSGLVSTLAGLQGVSGSVDGIGTNARFNYPNGISLTGAGTAIVVRAGRDV